MLKNYFIIGFRQLKKDKVFSSINIFGLSVSIAACILIFQYVFFELGYDQYHEDAKEIYRVSTYTYEDGQTISQSALSSLSVGPALKEKFPEVILSARLVSTRFWFNCTLNYKDGNNVRVFNEHHLYYADPSFLLMFSYPFVKGDKETALRKPYSLVLSSSAAKRYFGDEEALGKILFLKGSDEEHDYTVTGIMVDPPSNSHIDADILLSMGSLESNRNFKNKNFDAYTYVQLAPRSDSKNLKAKLPGLVSTFLTATNKTRIELDLQHIKDIHLHSSLQDEIKPGGNAKAIYFLVLVAFAILLIAWINYINLATSRSIARAKEVGIRKVSGATRSQLVYQFMTEAMIINVLSVLIALLLVYLFGPSFYQFTGLSFSYPGIFKSGDGVILYFLLVVFCIGVFLSGFYPGRIISSYKPALVLKGKLSGSGDMLFLRKTLVVFQFICAIGLTTAVLVFNQQFQYMQGEDLGIDINKTLIVKGPTNVDSTYLTQLTGFKRQLHGFSIIDAVTTSSSIPGEQIGWSGSVRKGKYKSLPKHEFIVNVVDPDFIDVYKLKLLAGRNFEMSDFPIMSHFGSKIEPVILNKKATNQLGYEATEDAIDATIFWNANECRVVGVIDDFHQQSLKSALQPILFTANTGPLLSLKLGKAVNNENITQSISSIRRSWNNFFPNNPFDYFFLDDFYASQYKRDEQVVSLFNFFCWLTIAISCLGLFGLSAFTVSQRTREVSIRKVLGASTLSLIELLTREFLFLVVIAACLALPFSYYGIGEWLQGFAFHIDLSGWSFVTPVFMILIVAFLAISTQTFKAVHKNPAETLKHE